MPRVQPQKPQKKPHIRTATTKGDALELLYGRHAVAAALGNPARQPHKLYLIDPALRDELDVPASLPVAVGTRQELDRLLGRHGMAEAVHQGIALATSPLPDLTLGEILEDAPGGKTGPLVLLDQVTDPHNIGAILRSAAAFGATALITTDRHAPHESGVLAKSASGALEQVPLVRVTNLARALKSIGEAGYWRMGLAEGGESLATLQVRFRGEKLALVMGAEGPGLRRLTAENCDLLVSLPTVGSFTTLNVSNAAAVALYAITQGA